MKLTKNNKNIKLAAATGVTLFSLTTVFVATIAWFAMNKNTDGNGLNVSVSNDSGIQILSCYAVRYDGNYGAIAVDVLHGHKFITMSEYDYIFTDRNVNTPLFLRMEVSHFAASGDLEVTIPCSGSYKTDNKINPYLSNVVSAKFLYGLKANETLIPDNYSWSGDNVQNSDVVSCYQGMLVNASDKVGTPFVVGGEKSDLITLSLNATDVFDEDFIVTRKDDNDNDVDAVVVYVELDYHVTNSVNLVTEYLNSYGGAQHSLSFTSDIEIITLFNEDSN